ncbi:hypothetical protein Vafri_8355 [Volvox africanus]|nr:hypothetical protein Vafri_8355 [Volvox africanus]
MVRARVDSPMRLGSTGTRSSGRACSPLPVHFVHFLSSTAVAVVPQPPEISPPAVVLGCLLLLRNQLQREEGPESEVASVAATATAVAGSVQPLLLPSRSAASASSSASNAFTNAPSGPAVSKRARAAERSLAASSASPPSPSPACSLAPSALLHNIPSIWL